MIKILKLFILILLTLFFSEILAQQNYIPGKSYYGRNKYIEYIPGNLPLVISAPHGGYEKPDEITDRSQGSDHHDKKTLETALEVQKRFYELTGKYPFVILNRLHRVKLDPNRAFEVATQGDSLSAIAYNEFHGFIDTAEKEVEAIWGKGLYIDIHAHNHKTQLIELGYLLESEFLAFPDNDLNDDLFIEKSSLRNLMKDTPYKFSEIVRGKVSFGAYLEKYGYKVVPSPSIPEPGTENFFAGGYNTQTHGPKDTNNFNSLQIELPWDYIRDSDLNIKKFSMDLTETIIEFMKTHYHLDLTKL